MKKHLFFFALAMLFMACGPVNPPTPGPNPDGDSTQTTNPTKPGQVEELTYQLTEFEDDNFGIKAYNFNVIFTKGETDFERVEIDLGGKKAYQYSMSKGTAYMLYIVSKQQRNKLPADGTYNIAYYPSDPSAPAGSTVPFGSLCRGYNGAAGMEEMTGGQHAPMGSFRMSHPGKGQYGTDYTDKDVYSYVTGGKVVIKSNENGTYTWDVDLTFSNFTSEKLTWTGYYN
jgi:hypothetical protein